MLFQVQKFRLVFLDKSSLYRLLNKVTHYKCHRSLLLTLCGLYVTFCVVSLVYFSWALFTLQIDNTQCHLIDLEVAISLTGPLPGVIGLMLVIFNLLFIVTTDRELFCFTWFLYSNIVCALQLLPIFFFSSPSRPQPLVISSLFVVTLSNNVACSIIYFLGASTQLYIE